jgi:hypothetical protein
VADRRLFGVGREQRQQQQKPKLREDGPLTRQRQIALAIMVA